MAAITSAALWHQIPELSRAKRLSSPFPHPKAFPENKNARKILPGALSYKKEYTTAVKYFPSPNFYRSQSCMIATQFCELKNRKPCK